MNILITILYIYCNTLCSYSKVTFHWCFAVNSQSDLVFVHVICMVYFVCICLYHALLDNHTRLSFLGESHIPDKLCS